LKTPKKPKLTPEELKKKEEVRKAANRKRQHIRSIRDSFTSAGFKHLTNMSKAGFAFKGKECDFDEVFVLDNVLVLIEHTSHAEDYIANHLVKKSIVFGYIHADPSGFISYLRSSFPEINAELDKKYADHQIQVCPVYCSLNTLKQSTKDHVTSLRYLDYPQLKYFLLLSRAIKLSTRFELLDFLGVTPDRFSDGILSSSTENTESFLGSVLPEAQSHLPPNYKVASFYVSAGALIQRSYVLRRDSWRSGTNIYQRILQKKKIDAIRRHLLRGKGKGSTFLNNIIVALPEGTKILGADGSQISPADIQKVTSAKIQLVRDFNSIAIIDGQHRVFSYFEGGLDEAAISDLRQQQNLLVTGVMMPPAMTERERDRFCASVFLQINSTQTSTKPELIQDIGVILRPFAVASLARRVLWKLNERGPFRYQFHTAFAEGEKVKTASIVNYGLVHLVRPGSSESLYVHWNDPAKEDLLKGATDESIDEAVIERYVDFCTREINKFTGAIKDSVATSRWTAARKTPNRLLTTTIVNGMIHALRRLSASNSLMENADYKLKLAKVDTFEFSAYTSSHYTQLGLDLVKEHFGL